MAQATRGRPRGFDRDTVLERAMLAFWAHGYEATSVADLTAAMGITPPSLYAAFGDKKGLFREAVRHYQRTFGGDPGQALDAAAEVREGVRGMLLVIARVYTDPAHPRGCLVISAATNCTPADADVEAELRELRNANVAALARRLADGGVPGAEAFARYLGAVIQGMSQQARDGATKGDLEQIAEAALRAWPMS
ncbi:TetR/AcrR family transcriptional regulator [Dactylosporangium darangshiense]|uniref:TetR/AcrR family transcriptional regulator n=2 Tax=Dactylosporangium darangshiense TaxID=579108 RepID=A0ABP8DKW9_9ACTN